MSITKKALGITQPFVTIPPDPVYKTTAPGTDDRSYVLGQQWIRRITADTRAAYIFCGLDSSGDAIWNITTPGASDVDTINTLSPAGGNITIAGGTNLTDVNAGSTVTLNLDAAITLATSVTSPSYLSAAGMAITSGAAIDINVAAGSNLTLQMGDAGGANVIDFEDSASATVASLNSNGQFSAVNLDGIIGAVTPAAGTFTTVVGSTSVTSPLYTATAAATKVEAAAGQNIVLNMSDNAGVQKVSFTDSDDVEVFAVDSNGGIPTIGGALTVSGLITGNASATINTAGAALNLGTDNAAGAVNIGNGTTIRTTSIGTVGGVAHVFAVGSASAGAITLDTAAGISLDSATASNFTVTGAADLALGSTLAGVNITSGEAASATGITIDATAADGGVTIDAGSGGVNIATTVGCTLVGVGDIAPTATRTITVGGGTVVTAAVTDTVDIGPDGATTNANSVKTVNVNTGGVTTGQVLTNIGTGTVTSGTHTTSIATGNRVAGSMTVGMLTGTGTKSLTVGNADGLTAINLNGGVVINNNVNANFTVNDGTSTGSITIGGAAAGAITLDTAAGISLDSATGSNFTVTGAFNLELASTAGDVNLSAGGFILLDSASAMELNSSAGAINIGNDANNGAINIGTGTAAGRAITVGNATGTSSLTLVSGTGEITVTGTVKQLNAEFVTRSGVDVTFQSSPILQATATTGAAPTGVTGATNLMLFQEGFVLEEFIKGAGQTIIAPRMADNGLLISLDQTATEGVEFNGGAALTTDKLSFVIGTSAAFYAECTFTVTDVSGCEPLYFGFRKTQANAADYTTYTDFVGYGLNNLVAGGDCVIATRLNSGGINTTDTNDAWADTGTHTLQVLVSAAGVVTFTFDGAPPTATQAFTFDNGDRVHFWYTHIFGAAAPGDIHWVDFKCGFQS